MHAIILTIAIIAASSQDYAHVAINITNNNPRHWYSLQRKADASGQWVELYQYNNSSKTAQELDYEVLPKAFYRVVDQGEH